MMTTDNSTPISEDDANHVNNPDNDNGKVQSQIDQEDRDALVKAEVGSPISESQVLPGRELVDGNGRRDTVDVDNQRPDVIVDENIDTQAKRDAAERDHAKTVEDKETDKLRQPSSGEVKQ